MFVETDLDAETPELYRTHIRMLQSVCQQLDRVLTSRTFARQDRLGRFLRHSVECTLRGDQGSVKEYVIGVEVFHRKASFDPRIDPIVRVEAGKLRKLLREYYRTEGTGDELVIEIPRGGYAARFGNRQAEFCHSIAILPFRDLSTDSNGGLLCRGIVEKIKLHLARCEGIRVATTSLPVGCPEGGGARELAKVLQASTLLEGTVSRFHRTVRLITQLVDAGSGFEFWRQDIERQIDDELAAQKELGRDVGEAVAAALRCGGREPVR